MCVLQGEELFAACETWGFVIPEAGQPHLLRALRTQMFLPKRICLLCFKFGIFLLFPCFWLSLFPSLMNAPFDGRSPAQAIPVHRQVCVRPGRVVDLQSSFYPLARSRCVPATVPSGRNGTIVDAWEGEGDLYPWLPPSSPHSRPAGSAHPLWHGVAACPRRAVLDL